MTPACRHCGSSRVVKDGLSSRTALYLRGGRIEQVAVPTTRLSCKACGRTSNVPPEDAEIARRAVREHVVERALLLGRDPAARETGLNRSTVSLLLEEWSSPREAEPARAAPDFLIVETARIRNRDRVLLGDVDRGSLVEILDGYAAIPEWANLPGRLHPLRVCHEPNPMARTVLSGCLPEAERMIAPAAAARSVRAVSLIALRGLRTRSPGSNGFPRPDEFLASFAGAIGPGWPSSAARLAKAARSALAVLASRDRAAAERDWPVFESVSSEPECRPILSLMRTWKDEILSGIDHRFVDTTWRLIRNARRAVTGRRPALSFDDVRRLALLRHFVSAEEGQGIPGRQRKVVAIGVDLARLPAFLA